MKRNRLLLLLRIRCLRESHVRRSQQVSMTSMTPPAALHTHSPFPSFDALTSTNRTVKVLPQPPCSMPRGGGSTRGLGRFSKERHHRHHQQERYAICNSIHVPLPCSFACTLLTHIHASHAHRRSHGASQEGSVQVYNSGRLGVSVLEAREGGMEGGRTLCRRGLVVHV